MSAYQFFLTSLILKLLASNQLLLQVGWWKLDNWNHKQHCVLESRD